LEDRNRLRGLSVQCRASSTLYSSARCGGGGAEEDSDERLGVSRAAFCRP